MGQERATPPTHREKIKKKKQNKTKRSEKGEGRDKEKYKKDRKKVINNDKNYSCRTQNGTACISTHVRSHAHTRAHTDIQNPVSKKSWNAM